MDVRIRAEAEHRLPEVGRRIPASAAQLRPEQVDELVRLYGEMKSVKGLARHLGIHHHTVRKHLIDRGVKIEQPRQMSDDELALATHLYIDEQLTAAQIAPKISFSASTIVKALNRAGVKMRPQVLVAMRKCPHAATREPVYGQDRVAAGGHVTSLRRTR